MLPQHGVVSRRSRNTLLADRGILLPGRPPPFLKLYYENVVEINIQWTMINMFKKYMLRNATRYCSIDGAVLTLTETVMLFFDRSR